MTSCVGTLSGHDDEVLDVAIDNRGIKLASASSDATVRLWNIAGDLHEIGVLEGHREEVSKGKIH